MRKPLSWEPVRRGPIYCSPACGARCSYAAYRAAVTQSARLARTLNTQLGPGWRPRVWENVGWHWAVLRGTVAVRRTTGARYWASFEAGPFNPAVSSAGYERSAAVAVRTLLARARQHAAAVTDALRAAEGRDA